MYGPAVKIWATRKDALKLGTQSLRRTTRRMIARKVLTRKMMKKERTRMRRTKNRTRSRVFGLWQ